MRPRYEIRPPRVGEAEAIGRMHVQVWREAYAGLMAEEVLAGLDPARRAERWRATALAEADGTNAGRELANRVAVAPDGTVVGFIAVGRPRDDDAPTPWQLWAINVLAQHHGTGVAQQLLDEVLGDRSAYLWVVEGNERARAFYRRNGFREDGGRLRDDDLGVDEIRMSR